MPSFSLKNQHMLLTRSPIEHAVNESSNVEALSKRVVCIFIACLMNWKGANHAMTIFELFLAEV